MTGPTFTAAPPAVRPVPARSAPPNRAALARPDVEGGGGNRVLTYLRLHWLTILFLGALIGSGLAYAAWQLVPPEYESYALFQVSSAPSLVTASGDPSRGRTEFNTYLKTTASLFKTEMVYTRALADLRENATLAAQKDPVKFLDQKLTVDTKDGLEIVRLGMKGTNAADVRAIVKAMTNSYYEQVVLAEYNLKVARRNALQIQQTEWAGRLKSKMGPGVAAGLPGELPATPGAAAPKPPADGQPPAPDADFIKRMRLPELLREEMKLRAELPSYDAEAERLKAGIAATKDALQRLLDEPASADAVDAAKKDEAYLRAKTAAEMRDAEYRARASRALEPNSATMTALKTAADAAREEANAILAAKAKTFEAEKRRPLFAQLSKEVTLAQAVLNQLARRKESATQTLARLAKEVRETPPPLATAVAASGEKPKGPLADPTVTDILATDKMYEQLTAHLIALDMEVSGGQKRVMIKQEASTPQVVDAKKQWMATGVAGLMGFALVAGCVLLAETRARKVSSLGELKGTTPTPVVGVVPWMPDGATARDPLKRADVNEAIDKLRAYVVQSWLSRGASTVTVTSALGDEGKAFTAFGLASSLAQAGYKTLLVDFDLRNPGLHSFAGVPNASGVCELLRGEADFRKTIQILPNGLHFLAAGKWSDDARQAAVGGRLEALLNRLKEPFDCVVLHGHALLTVAESVEVARRSEVVLLCALYRDTRGPMLKRATDRVASMEIPFAGVVYLGATPNEALC